ncbi:MAG: putative toxin-antitoxin system toxin component, PIN family [Lysobacterales bacterium]
MTAMTLVIDTNVCLDLFVFEDPRCLWLMHGLEQGSMRALASTPMREEWLRVLARPGLALSASRQRQAQAAYDRWIQAHDPTGVSPDVRLPRCADKDDQMFVQLAAEIGAGALLSRDRALLVLSRRSHAAAGFVIMTPEQFQAHWRDLPARRSPVSG